MSEPSGLQKPAKIEVQVEPDDSSDLESTYGDSIASYTTSLNSSITDYRLPHAKRRGEYKRGLQEYIRTEISRKAEKERLDILHHMTTLLLEGKLYLAPIDKHPQRVLDIGTGTGIWAIEMGDEYPSADVLGVDLSPIQPRINIKPGCWVELQDYDHDIYSEDGSLKEDSNLRQWNIDLLKAFSDMGRDASPGAHLRGWVTDAGFENVTHKVLKVPIGPWAKEKRLKDIGNLNLINLLEGMEAISVAPFTRSLGWSQEKVQALLVGVRKDVQNPRIHAIYDLLITIMRLLKLRDDNELSLDEFVGDSIPPYAILSHTWGADDEEVTFKDLVEGTGKIKAGYKKIQFCTTQAANDGLQFSWVDTCCIDKSSSMELSEAINSMFRWYHNAAKCYVYLSDVSIGGFVGNDPSSLQTWKSVFQHSRWFTRGWTLQELIAPTAVEFFSVEGERLGDRNSMVQEIHGITRISIQALQGTLLSRFSVNERMSWAARRETKREEDAAYSLLGIFGVHMPLIYGEGRKKAFIRLRKEIEESLKDEWPILPRSTGTEDDSKTQASSFNGGPVINRSTSDRYVLPHQRQDEANDVFDNVITGFRDSLSPKEKEMFKWFNSSEEMLSDLQSRCKNVQNDHTLSSLCRKIERLAAVWKPFFEIITIFVRNPSEFAGLAWGAIHLVFLLGTKHMTYLERIVSMIQNIGESLPAYGEYFEMFVTHKKKTESEIGSAIPTEIRYHRLFKALSYVYADIVQFCQESRKIFGTKHSVHVHYKPSVISNLPWKPFDARLSAILDRLRSHRGFFRREMQLEESKYLELQNEKRARQPELGEEALRNIWRQVEDLRLSNEHLESKITSQFDMFESKLREREFNEDISEEIERKEAEVINFKASGIKEWVDAPEYMREFEKAQRTRLPETGGYLLNDPIYKNWKLGRTLQHGEVSGIITPEFPRILFIKGEICSSLGLLDVTHYPGKPGYGKTVLSSLLIEDLRDVSMSSTGDLSSHGSVFFYHFASERRDHCGPYSALRAVLVQLVHRFQSHKNIIDQITILMELNNGGKLKASDEEIFAALSLLLEGLEHTVLVFDGLDECEEHTTLLELIRELCASTTTRVLLLSRPNVGLPMRFHHLSLYLHQSSNFQDIKLYLEPQILLLRDRGLIPGETSLGAAVDTLASRAEGMFLWTWLMTQYLNCRALSPKERLEAIFEAADIEGLHDVYGKILRVLNQGYAKERASARKIFELIAIAFHPFLVTELQVAVAITPGKVTEKSSFIVEFEESLPIICGALVEVQSDGTVRFIHSSFRDFLASASEVAHCFSIDERAAHVRCSTISLSYLVYDLPSSPLRQTTPHPSIEDLKISFPFIEYALQWVKHAASGFQAGDILQKPFELNVQDDFYTILAKLISRPLTITVWIEALSIFRMKPSLKPLIALCSNRVSLASASLFNTGNLAVTLLKELAADLERLDAEWGHLLERDPSAIWGPSITAFSRSSFWFETKNTAVTSMLLAEAAGSFRSCSPQRPVLIQSQVSGAGHELGIVLVLPSRSYLVAAESVFGVPARNPERNSSFLSDEEKQRLAKVCSSGWKVRYQRRNVINEEILMDFEVDLPERQVFQMLQQYAKALAFVFGQLQPSAIDCRLVQVWSEAVVDGDWPSYQCKGEVMTSRLSLSWREATVRDQFAFHPFLPLMVFTEWSTTAAWMFNDVGKQAQ
ncbi:hypothetical protein GP486_003875 [Trichoglossum hirsutum]|uniref:Heterokaryon incompatibility domain-containing protein n=1 Tax=Trichoglossum hirsutum TaxID=265104 RepID=A0A9P8LC22_9PEZI|nr:hypothetical protein GP486_003875 [Trichoglossum hirsutum]